MERLRQTTAGLCCHFLFPLRLEEKLSFRNTTGSTFRVEGYIWSSFWPALFTWSLTDLLPARRGDALTVCTRGVCMNIIPFEGPDHHRRATSGNDKAAHFRCMSSCHFVPQLLTVPGMCANGVVHVLNESHCWAAMFFFPRSGASWRCLYT